MSRDIILTQGCGTMNENGFLFAECCQTHNLVIGGSIFHHKSRIHKFTWTGPDGRARNQIDPIAIDRRFRRSLLDVKTRRGADVASDHELDGKVQLKLCRQALIQTGRLVLVDWCW